MTTKNLILVAEKFGEFAKSNEAVVPGQVRAMLSLPRSLMPKRLVLHRGQGVPDDVVQEILSVIAFADPEASLWDVSNLVNRSERASGEHSHKHNACNTLVTDPVRLDADTYELDLCIDHNCELMGDHQTGQHIQGMILIEASRQAFLVVTERFFLVDRNQKSYFVINSVSSEFSNFVFPVHAYLVYRVVAKDLNERRQKFEVEIDVMQYGKLCMATRFAFTVYPASLIAEKERALAEEAAFNAITLASRGGMAAAMNQA